MKQDFVVGDIHQVVTDDFDELFVYVKKYSKVVLYADINAFRLHEELLSRLHADIVMKILPSEEHKSLKFVSGLMEDLADKGLDRNSVIVAFGGGFIGDIAGYIASQFMRGIDFVQVPTTFMSMCDCVIGKVAVNSVSRKNVFGRFYSPALVVINTRFLSTLPDKEINRGLVESLKCYFVSGSRMLGAGFDTYNSFLEIIFESISIKKDFVIRDPYDRNGSHKALSYGHTFANTLESIDKKNFRHGDAVLVGMMIAARVSFLMGMLQKDFVLHQSLCMKLFDGIGISFVPSSDVACTMIELLKHDKLSCNGSINLVLLREIGDFGVFRDVDEKIIYNAIMSYGAI